MIMYNEQRVQLRRRRKSLDTNWPYGVSVEQKKVQKTRGWMRQYWARTRRTAAGIGRLEPTEANTLRMGTTLVAMLLVDECVGKQ